MRVPNTRVDRPIVSTVALVSIVLLIGALLIASPAWTDRSVGSPEDAFLGSPIAHKSANAPGVDSIPGEALVPSNQDGFETGDFRNFSPRYIGDDGRWVRPSMSVSSQSPIEGEYSLRWTSDSTTQHWVHVSNAFYLRAPMEVSTIVRLEKAAGRFSVGLALLETEDRSATLRLRPGGARLSTGPPSQSGGKASPFTPEPDTPYRLTLNIGDDGRLEGTVARARDGRVVSELSGTVDLAPVALGLYVYLPAGTSTRAVFDEVEVQSAPYRIEAGRWIRSPNFVVLPRRPDVGLDQGNWVGAPSVMREGGRLRMWYRIRSNQSRGVGYGHAASQNGVHWKKSEQNPLFKHDPSYWSNEKMSVLKVEGVYRAWYTVDVGGKWVIAHATSPDGLQWEKRNLAISRTYAKDPVVVYVDGTYYLYSISPTRTDLSVYTSQDGRDWIRQNVISMQVHRHPGAYYVEETGTFWLYAFGGGRGVSRAASGDGIHEVTRGCPARERGEESCGLTGLNGRSILARKRNPKKPHPEGWGSLLRSHEPHLGTSGRRARRLVQSRHRLWELCDGPAGPCGQRQESVHVLSGPQCLRK